MNLLIIFVVLFGHWLSDFVLQKNKQKPTRSKKLRDKIEKLLKHLLPHTLIYSCILTVFIGGLYLLNVFGQHCIWNIGIFFIVTYITHFITDFTVTMINQEYLRKNKRHQYFVSIGLDQLIHYFILFLSIQIIYF